MSDPQKGKSIGRSIWALFLGFLVVVALSLGTDLALHAAGIYPELGKRMSDILFVAATIYRTLYSVVGCYVTARFAPNKPMQHALLGGAIGLVLAIIGAVATWNKDLGPHWYPLALIGTALPAAWFGAKLWITSASQKVTPGS